MRLTEYSSGGGVTHAPALGRFSELGIDPSFKRDLANGWATIVAAIHAPALYMKRRRIERRNAWLAERMSTHLRRDIGVQADMRPGGRRTR